MKWPVVVLASMIVLFIYVATVTSQEISSPQNIASSITNSAKSIIIDENTEKYDLGNGKTNAVFYSGKTFQYYNGQYYDFASFANISVADNKILISSLDGMTLTLNPYVVYSGMKVPYNLLASNVKNQISISNNITKNRNYFEFATSFTNTNEISEIGFDFTGSSIITDGNKTIIGNNIVVDFTDLAKMNYTISVNDSSIRITNLKPGLNVLDPIVQFNSTSSDGQVRGPFNSTGDGDSCCVINNSATSISGLFRFMGTSKEFRKFFNFNTSSIGSNATIKSVNLSFYLDDISDSNEDENNPATCHIGDWGFEIRSGTFIRNPPNTGLSIDDYSKGISIGTAILNDSIRYTLSLNTTSVNKTGDSDYVIKPLFGSSGDPCFEWIIISDSEDIAPNRPYLSIDYTVPVNESEGRRAINDAISATINSSIRTTDQQIYTVDENGNQQLGRFDKVAVLNNQTWAFNYVTGNETFTNMTNLGSTVIVWEGQLFSYNEIRGKVENLINNTKV